MKKVQTASLKVIKVKDDGHMERRKNECMGNFKDSFRQLEDPVGFSSTSRSKLIVTTFDKTTCTLSFLQSQR